MRISEWARGAAAALLIACGAAPALSEPAFKSVEDALRRGIEAYESGLHEEAAPALEFAAEKDEFLAEYYLARIYGDNSGGRTDHAKAYALYQKIADAYADSDPDDAVRARFVGNALTALAGYLRTGLPGVAGPDPAAAASYLRHAALFFRNEDAQFELAKMQLTDGSGEGDAENAKHWLAVLSQKGHPGAQAFLADLYWRGEHMERDSLRALLLATLAVTSASLSDSVWIEDIHQNIFCGASGDLRAEASRRLADWRKRYGRKPDAEHVVKSAVFDVAPQRTCGDREAVIPIEPAAKVEQAGAKTEGGAEPRPFLEGAVSAGAVQGVGGELPPARTP